VIFIYSQKLITGILALVLVAGMTSPAFAGADDISSCTIDPDKVSLQLALDEESDPFLLTISCDGPVNGFVLDTTCQGIAGGFVYSQGVGTNTITFMQTLENQGGIPEQHCTLTFNMDPTFGGSAQVFQEVWITPHEKPVAGELLSVNSTSLVVAGLTSSMAWMIPAVAGLAGAGIYLVKYRTNKE